MRNGSTARSPHGIYPGSFDPLTLGHLDVIERAAAVFTRLTVAVVANPQKREPLFDLQERKALVERCVAHLPHVDVRDFRGLLADFVREQKVDVIVKGLRVVSDFEVEMSTAMMNRSLSNVDTMFLMSDQHYSFISSSLVKEVFFLGGDVAKYVPDVVLHAMVAKREAKQASPPRPR